MSGEIIKSKIIIPKKLLKRLGLPTDIINLIDDYVNKELEGPIIIYENMKKLLEKSLFDVLNLKALNTDYILEIMVKNYIKHFGKTFHDFLILHPDLGIVRREYDGKHQEYDYYFVLDDYYKINYFHWIFEGIMGPMFSWLSYTPGKKFICDIMIMETLDELYHLENNTSDWFPEYIWRIRS